MDIFPNLTALMDPGLEHAPMEQMSLNNYAFESKARTQDTQIKIGTPKSMVVGRLRVRMIE